MWMCRSISIYDLFWSYYIKLEHDLTELLTLPKMCNNFLYSTIRRESLLIYNIIWSLLYSCFLTGPWFLRQIPSFLRQYLSSVFFFFSVISLVWSSVGCLRPLSMFSARVVQPIKGGKYEVRQKMKEFCVGVLKTILERDLLRQSQILT